MIRAKNTPVIVLAGVTGARRSRRAKRNSLAHLLAREVIPRNAMGFTFDPRSWSFPAFEDDVFIVSLDGHEHRFRQLPAVADVRRWLREVEHLLQRHDVFVGWCLDREDRRYCLDLSVPIRGRRCAEAIGRLYGQSAIYHPASGIDIPLRRTKAA